MANCGVHAPEVKPPKSFHAVLPGLAVHVPLPPVQKLLEPALKMKFTWLAIEVCRERNECATGAEPTGAGQSAASVHRDRPGDSGAVTVDAEGAPAHRGRAEITVRSRQHQGA